jgi:hypothetical protein
MSNKINRLVEEISGGTIVNIFSGGSVASTFLVKYSDKKETVIKFSNSDGINNGRRKLIREAAQNNYLVNKYPKHLSVLLPKVLRTWNHKLFSAIEYEYFSNSCTFADIIREGKWDFDKIEKELTKFLCLVFNLYEINSRKKKNSFFVEKNLIRATFRIDYTKRKNIKLQLILNSKYVVINNKKFVNPQELIQSIKTDKKLMKSLETLYISDCIHGDLNLKNILIDSQNCFKLLDLRGSRQSWDFFYDLGKILFTSGFDPICNFEFKPQIQNDGSIFFSSSHPEKNIIENWLNFTVITEKILSDSPIFSLLRQREKHWKLKVRIIFALHFLADSACRLIAGSKINQPLSSYILGTVYLNRAMSDKSTKMSANDFYSLVDIL